MFFPILLSLLALFVTYVVISYYKAIKIKGNLPGPPIYPILNNDYIFWGDRTKAVDSLFKKYGDTFITVSGLLLAVIHTKNPGNAQHVMSDKHNFVNYKRLLPWERNSANSNSPFFAGLKFFGNGIFFADDEIWGIQRLHAKPLFKKEKIADMTPIFVQNSNIVLEILGNTKKGEPVDMQNVFMRYTLDSFGKIAFGIDLKSLDLDVDFPKFFDKAQNMLFTFNSFILNPLIYKRQYQFIIDQLDKFIYSVIDKKRKEENLEEKPDLISRFMSLRDTDGKSFPDKWIRDIILNFMIAGRDTTATLLMWTFYLLGKNPSVLEKAIEEVNILKGKPPTTESMQPLKYLDNVLKESLRVRAPVPGTTRVAVKPDVLPDGTKVPAGVRVKYWAYFMHRDPKYWDEPESFKPERWTNPKVLRHSYQYLPFHGGPMSCLGRKMATLEAKVLMIMILQKFRLETLDNHAYKPFIGIITNCVGGAPMRVIPLDTN